VGYSAGDKPVCDDPRIARGTTHLLLAMDIAFAVDLGLAQRLVLEASGGGVGGAERVALPHGRKSPPYFEYQPAPVRVTLPGKGVALHDGAGAVETEGAVEAVIFDFGAVSLTYRVGLSGPMSNLVALGEELSDNKAVLADAYERLRLLVAVIGPALTRPGLQEGVEDYIVHHVEELEGVAAPGHIQETHGGLLARILRAEREAMSDQEITDALQARASYRPGDATLIDWNAAVILDREGDDVRAVLEFANVEALEMRLLDDRLDADLEKAYSTVQRPPRLLWVLPAGAGHLRRLAGWQTDSAQLYESVNNALKLIGDQYLARVYRLASERFHLPERDTAIERKLGVIQGLYEKLNDYQSNLRMEVLEWLIIALTILSVWPLIRGE
jgi:hypothetical protein